MSKKHRSTQIRQKQIIDAAQSVIVKYGSEHVTIKRIAKEVGISEAAIYRHFKSKRDILSLMIDNIENTLITDIEMKPAHKSFTRETLEGVFRHHISQIIQRKGVSFQVIAEIISLGDKKLNRKVFAVIDNYTARIEDVLQKGVKAGILRQDIDLEAAAGLYFGMIQGLVNTWALSQYRYDLEKKYAPAWHIFLDAIVK
jgi:AcrR family transcriptional regulator